MFFCIEAFNFLIYLLMLSLHAVVLREHAWSIAFVLLLSFVEFTWEVWQGIAQGFRTYFSDMWNLIDYFSLISVWLYCGFYLADILHESRLWILALSLLQLW